MKQLYQQQSPDKINSNQHMINRDLAGDQSSMQTSGENIQKMQSLLDLINPGQNHDTRQKGNNTLQVNTNNLYAQNSSTMEQQQQEREFETSSMDSDERIEFRRKQKEKEEHEEFINNNVYQVLSKIRQIQHTVRKQPNQRQKMEFLSQFENTYGLNSKNAVSQQTSLRNLTQRKSSNVSATPLQK